MRAMLLNRPASGVLDWVERAIPSPASDQVLLRVRACGVCRTDVHLVDGELPDVRPPVVPGHEVIGIVEQVGDRVATLRAGQRVGVPWLGFSCGVCEYCIDGRENLCDRAEFTGYQRDGGYAEFAVADARFVFPIPPATATSKRRRCCVRA